MPVVFSPPPLTGLLFFDLSKLIWCYTVLHLTCDHITVNKTLVDRNIKMNYIQIFSAMPPLLKAKSLYQILRKLCKMDMFAYK